MRRHKSRGPRHWARGRAAPLEKRRGPTLTKLKTETGRPQTWTLIRFKNGEGGRVIYSHPRPQAQKPFGNLLTIFSPPLFFLYNIVFPLLKKIQRYHHLLDQVFF